MRALVGGPLNRSHERIDGRRKLAIEDPRGDELHARTLLANRRGHRGAVSDAIDEIAGIGVGDERAPAGDATHVRMIREHAAVEQRDGNAAAGAARKRSIGERESHARQCVCCSVPDEKRLANDCPSPRSVAAVPSSTMRPFSNTRTRSARRARSSRCVMMIVVRPAITAS